MAVKPGVQTQTATKPPQVPPDIRNQLLKRLAVAGGLVAILLALLAAFDYMTQPVDETPVRVFSEPVPVGPKKGVTQPVVPMVQAPDMAALPADTQPAETDVQEPSPVAAPVTPSQTINPPPGVPARQVVGAVNKANGSEVHNRLPAPSRPITPLAATPAPQSEASEIVAERTAPPPMAVAPPDTPTPATPSPSVTVRDTRPPAGGQPPAPPRLFSGFVLQAGIFSSVERAEALHAKLTLSGVPSQIETRVQVGPFRTRQEAAEAQAKLRELGVETVLVSPKGGR